MNWLKFLFWIVFPLLRDVISDTCLSCLNRGQCTSVSPSPSPLAADILQIKGHIFLSPQPLNFQNAIKFCTKEGGSIIHGETSFQLRLLAAFLKKVGNFYPPTCVGTWIHQRGCTVVFFQNFTISSSEDCANDIYFVAACWKDENVNSSMTVPADTVSVTCQCPAGYGYENCTKLSYSDISTSICCSDCESLLLEAKNSNIIFVDHALLGKPMFFEGSGCSSAHYAYKGEDVCVSTTTLSTLRYWCQGKKSCHFRHKDLYSVFDTTHFFIPDIPISSYSDGVEICEKNHGQIGMPRTNADFQSIHRYAHLFNETLPSFWIHPDTFLHLDKETVEVKWVSSPQFYPFPNNLCLTLGNSNATYSLSSSSSSKEIVHLHWSHCDKSNQSMFVVCKATPAISSSDPCLKNLKQKLLEVRYHEEPDLTTKEISCPANVDYRRGNTCYRKTTIVGDWWMARQQCWSWGGELAFPLPKKWDQCSTKIYLRDTEELWLAGDESCGEDRCQINFDSPSFREGVFDSSNDLCFPELGLDQFCSKIASCFRKRRGLCALPPIRHVIKQCPPIHEDNFPSWWPYTNYSWKIPGTPGKMSSYNCPDGQSGLAVWFCDQNGHWIDLPDLIGCTKIDTTSALKSLDEIAVIPSNVIERVYNNIIEEDTMAAGDISAVLKVLEKALKIQNDQLSEEISDPETYSIEYAKTSTQTFNAVLGRHDSWIGLTPSDLRNQISRIQVNVNDFSKSLMKHTTDDQEFSFSNIVVRTTGESLPNSFDIGDSSISIKKSNSNTRAAFYGYLSLACILHHDLNCDDRDINGTQIINGAVLGAKLYDKQMERDLTSDVDVMMTFKHDFRGTDYNLSNPQCVFWDISISDWSSKGCRVVYFDESFTHCHCEHLTNFAVLMDFNGLLRNQDTINNIITAVTIIGCSMSILSLLFGIFVFSVVLRRNGGERVEIHRNLCLCLLAGEIVLLSGLNATYNRILCAIVAGILHYSFLTAFCWMLVEGIHIYFMLIKIFDSGQSYLRYYYLFGYGIPLLVVGISALVMELNGSNGYGSQDYCWLDFRNGLIWAFNGPVLVIILINICLYLMALKIARDSISKRSNDHNGSTKKTMAYFKGSTSLLCILGITWIFGFAFFAKGFEWVAVIFAVLNSLQGVFIVIFHVVLNEKARQDTLRYFKRNILNQHWLGEVRSAFNEWSSNSKDSNNTQEVSLTSKSN